MVFIPRCGSFVSGCRPARIIGREAFTNKNALLFHRDHQDGVRSSFCMPRVPEHSRLWDRRVGHPRPQRTRFMEAQRQAQGHQKAKRLGLPAKALGLRRLGPCHAPGSPAPRMGSGELE